MDHRRRIGVICIDDSPGFLLALRATLEAADIDVLAVETDCPTGVKLVEELRPDLVTLDLEMPTMDGATATRTIAALPNPPPVVIVTGRTQPRVGAGRTT